MTLLPSKEFGIRGYPGKQHEIGARCAVPGCPEDAQHGHHLWPRSYLRGQPYEWVQLPDGTVIGNRVPLCVEHHNMVTGEIGGYRARIVWEQGVFYWHLKEEDQRQHVAPLQWQPDQWQHVAPLQWQPPGVRLHEANDKPSSDPDDRCPECGKPKHSRPHTPRPKRKSKNWTLAVPDDAEIGAEILDGWVDDIAEILGMADESSRLRRYHAAAIGFAWIIQNRDMFVADLVEAARS